VSWHIFMPATVDTDAIADAIDAPRCLGPAPRVQAFLLFDIRLFE
jgi:hypothetical protein